MDAWGRPATRKLAMSSHVYFRAKSTYSGFPAIKMCVESSLQFAFSRQNGLATLFEINFKIQRSSTDSFVSFVGYRQGTLPPLSPIRIHCHCLFPAIATLLLLPVLYLY